KPESTAEIPVALSTSERVRWHYVLEPFVMHVVSAMKAGNSGHQNTTPTQPQEGLAAGEGYFESLWQYCSRQERLTLVQVSEEGLTNPRQGDSVGRLLEKGLLTLRPNLKLMTPAFERFVQRAADSTEVRRWERPEHALGWRGARWVLLVVVLAALFF